MRAITITAKFSNGPNDTARWASGGHQRGPREGAADHGRGVAEPERPAGVAAPSELVAVQAGHDRVGFAGNAHQGGGDQAARHAAHEHRDEQRDRLDAAHLVGERQREGHERARRDPRQDAHRDAERDAADHDREGLEREEVQEGVGERHAPAVLR
jgi:hypothetical protein